MVADMSISPCRNNIQCAVTYQNHVHENHQKVHLYPDEQDTVCNKRHHHDVTTLTVPTVCPLLMQSHLSGFCTFCSATIPFPRLCTVNSAVVVDHVIIIA